MQSFSADDPVYSRYSRQIRPAMTSFADEVCATVARLFAYVGVLALFGILSVRAWDQFQVEWATEPVLGAGWSLAEGASPAFALSRENISGRDTPDKSDKSEIYLTFRHPSGGRKEVLRWSGSDGTPLAELEIYRPGAEYDSPAAARAELASRMLARGARLESAGVIETKFGSVALLRQAGSRVGPGSCLGFFKRIDDPTLQISGWSCRGDSLPTRRASIECMLDRLVSLTTGNDPKLGQLFAPTGVRRGSCAEVTAATDWITDAEGPTLRGSL